MLNTWRECGTLGRQKPRHGAFRRFLGRCPSHTLVAGGLLGPQNARLNNLGYDFNIMKVAYVFSSSGQTVDYILGDMILPQLESGDHVNPVIAVL